MYTLSGKLCPFPFINLIRHQKSRMKVISITCTLIESKPHQCHVASTDADVKDEYSLPFNQSERMTNSRVYRVLVNNTTVLCGSTS